MTKLLNSEKSKELQKYRELNLAVLDYLIESPYTQMKSEDFDSKEHFESVKEQVNKHFEKGRLTMLKQYFRDLTEWPREVGDLNINSFLKDKTGYEMDLNHQFDKRLAKIVERQKIKSPAEYRDVLAKVDNLHQKKTSNQEHIENLNKLLAEFDQKKSLKNL